MASSARPNARQTRTAPSAAEPRKQSRRKLRLKRGPLVIGEASPAVEPRLAACEPYRADTVIDGGSAFGLTSRAASVRGLSKRWSGEPRQDDICLARHEPTRVLIAAVADGVSGAPRSHIGAALAVRQAVAAATRQLDRGDELDWQEVFDHAAWALLDAHRSSSNDASASLDGAAAMFASTLLVAVIGAPERASREAAVSRVQLACVGDSPALLLSRGGFRPLLGAQDGPQTLLNGSVDALPRASRRVCSACCELAQRDVLLLCTDGFSLPLADGENEVGEMFARELSRPPDIVDFARLLDFSRSTYDDDRTLIAIWPRSRE
jgi:serine/threonine protein phosphatase PrpC